MQMEGMPLRDRLYMLPVERYEKYGKYPWRLLIDVLLLVFTTAQLLIIVTPSNLYAQNQLSLWKKVLVPEQPQIYSIESLQTVLRCTIADFKNINTASFDDYEFVDQQLHVYRYDSLYQGLHSNITQEDLG